MSFWRNWRISKHCRQYAWIAGVLLGVLFLGIGMAQGQFETIWKKAVMICMECIGIG
ncbi:MAG: hypothetical protein HFH91_03650 [Lachnospiraceae bacterium]|nr:hypothetical protein [Lachnospiraceae bacterium]